MTAPWTALVEWLIATKLPGASAATSRLTIEYASPVPEMWCKTPSSRRPAGWAKSSVRDHVQFDLWPYRALTPQETEALHHAASRYGEYLRLNARLTLP